MAHWGFIHERARNKHYFVEVNGPRGTLWLALCGKAASMTRPDASRLLVDDYRACCRDCLQRSQRIGQSPSQIQAQMIAKDMLVKKLNDMSLSVNEGM